MKDLHQFSGWRLLGGMLLMLLLAGCPSTPEAQPLAPTRTPMPTFTPTPEGPVVDVAATEAAAVAATAAAATAAAQPQEAVPTDTPAESQPRRPNRPATPTPASAQATVSQEINVRGGPGTNYPIIWRGTTGHTVYD